MLDAYVMCACFRNGLATAPPFPREWIEIDGEGRLALAKQHSNEVNDFILDEWAQKSCTHEDLVLCYEHLGWSACARFQEALDDVGQRYFPVLLELLPNSTKGAPPSMASADALRELDAFSSHGEISRKTVLINTMSREILCDSISACDGILLSSSQGQATVGVDTNGFYAKDITSGAEIFRASRFRQYSVLSKTLLMNRTELFWEDLDSAITVKAPVVIAGRQDTKSEPFRLSSEENCSAETVQEFHVEQQARLAWDYQRIVQALRHVFEASIATGNPVCWG